MWKTIKSLALGLLHEDPRYQGETEASLLQWVLDTGYAWSRVLPELHEHHARYCSSSQPKRRQSPTQSIHGAPWNSITGAHRLRASFLFPNNSA